MHIERPKTILQLLCFVYNEAMDDSETHSSGGGASHANYTNAIPTRKNLTRYDYDSSLADNLYELQIERTTDSFSAERINNLILCKVMIPHLTAAPTLT